VLQCWFQARHPISGHQLEAAPRVGFRGSFLRCDMKREQHGSDPDFNAATRRHELAIKQRIPESATETAWAEKIYQEVVALRNPFYRYLSSSSFRLSISAAKRWPLGLKCTSPLRGKKCCSG
jgi:hypothetical protein